MPPTHVLNAVVVVAWDGKPGTPGEEVVFLTNRPVKNRLRIFDARRAGEMRIVVPSGMTPHLTVRSYIGNLAPLASKHKMWYHRTP